MPFPNTLSKLPFQNPLSQNADDPHDPGDPDDFDYPDKLITWGPFFSFLFLSWFSFVGAYLWSFSGHF